MTPWTLFLYLCALAAGLLPIGGVLLLGWATIAWILSAGRRGR